MPGPFSEFNMLAGLTLLTLWDFTIGTVIGCICAPIVAERLGRKRALALYFVGMAAMIPLAFGWAFYLAEGLKPFLAILFFLGFAARRGFRVDRYEDSPVGMMTKSEHVKLFV